MEKKRTFQPGDPVRALTGHAGMVVSEEAFAGIKRRLREGHRPGRYFAPGCCHNPDYVTQIPVLFEDGTWDVMRAMNIRRAPDLPEEKRSAIRDLACIR